jgi:hypothetical protein
VSVCHLHYELVRTGDQALLLNDLREELELLPDLAWRRKVFEMMSELQA